jgi:hypothetical protein
MTLLVAKIMYSLDGIWMKYQYVAWWSNADRGNPMYAKKTSPSANLYESNYVSPIDVFYNCSQYKKLMLIKIHSLYFKEFLMCVKYLT